MLCARPGSAPEDPGREAPEVAQSLDALGLAQQNLSYLDEARSCYRAIVRLRRGLFGEVHPSVAASLNRQADLLRRERRLDDADALFRSALRMLETTLGPDAPETAEVLCNLGLVQYFREDYKTAELYSRRAMDLDIG